MKSYPSIPKFDNDSIRLHTFDKLDGSNIRIEWTKKRGWFKFGTRNRLFDQTDQQFGEAIPLFFNVLAEPLACICTDQRWQKVVVFAEFWGANSFAGLHVAGEPKHLTVIDVSPHQNGILGPKDFLKLFGEFGPNYLGDINWNKDFIERVRNSSIEGITFEGVVGKVLHKKQIQMYKTKTQQWRDKVKLLYGNKANEILDS